MAPGADAWPECYAELLPNVLFSVAEKKPLRTYAEFQRDAADVAKGFRRFTYAEVANAVNAFAWWVDRHVGALKEEEKNGSRTLVYMGPSDIRYAVLCLGSIVAGYTMLFPSPRYGAEALVRLIEAVDAKVLLSPETPYPVQAEVLEAKKEGLRTLQLPSVEQLFAEKVPKYPFTKTFEACKDEPFICLHTSGTTGFPKPIIWTHDWVASQARALSLPPPAGFAPADAMDRGDMDRGIRDLVTTPPFHASGILYMVLNPLMLGATPVYAEPGSTPQETVDGALSALAVLEAQQTADATKPRDKVIDCVTMNPPCIEYLAKHPTKLEQFAQKAHALRYGGGSVSHAAGAAITQKMRLVCTIGATELGVWPRIRRAGDELRDDGKWEYMALHPAFNLRFDAVSQDAGDTVYECVTVRNNGRDWDGFVQAVFKIYPHLHEKETGDLFVQHPRYPGCWKHHGRADDLLVFLSNEKFFPTAAEQRLGACPGIVEALMVGTRRPRAALILRLEQGVGLDDVWDRVEEVNASSPVYARVDKDMVLVVREPFLMTAKGSVRKLDMLRRYEKELDELYAGKG